MPVSISTARHFILELGRWSVLLCLFFVSFNKPGTNIFIGAALLCTILGERSSERLVAATKHPVVIGSLLLLLAHFLSVLYTPTGQARWDAFRIDVALLYPLIVASLLESQQWRNRGMAAFGLSVSIILVISWLQFFGVVPQRQIALDLPSFRYTVFNDYTQQGIVCLLLAAMAASFAQTETDRRRKAGLWGIVAASLVNVIFLLQSRTSYLIVVPLLLFWVWALIGGRRASRRGLALGLCILAISASIAMMTPRVHERLQQAQQDISLYNSKREATSMGIRLELWKRTLPIIASAPLFGHGLGQWQTEYVAEVKDFTDYDEFRMMHPHQEALLILAEQGIAGLAFFIVLLICLGRYIARLKMPQRNFYASLLLIYISASLANCLWVVFMHRNVFMMLLACIPLIPNRGEPTPDQTT